MKVRAKNGKTRAQNAAHFTKKAHQEHLKREAKQRQLNRKIDNQGLGFNP